MQPSPDFPEQDRRCDFTSARGRKISQRGHKLVCQLYGRRDNSSLLALLFTAVRFVDSASSPHRDLSRFCWLHHGSYIPWEMFKVPLASMVEPGQPLRIMEEPNGPHHHNKAAAQQDGIYRIILLNKIKEMLKQHNANPSQSHLCGIEPEAPHTTEPHYDLF